MGLKALVKAKLEKILKVCATYSACNMRVFGSVACGEADEQKWGSDYVR